MPKKIGLYQQRCTQHWKSPSRPFSSCRITHTDIAIEGHHRLLGTQSAKILGTILGWTAIPPRCCPTCVNHWASTLTCKNGPRLCDGSMADRCEVLYFSKQGYAYIFLCIVSATRRSFGSVDTRIRESGKEYFAEAMHISTTGTWYREGTCLPGMMLSHVWVCVGL